MHILYYFVCYDLFHILLFCDKIIDPWNVYMYVCMYVCMYFTNILGICDVHGCENSYWSMAAFETNVVQW
jgi:hypothetical protein